MKRDLVVFVVLCSLLLAANPTEACDRTDWQSVHVDSLEGTPASFFLRIALLEVFTVGFRDSLQAGNEWWCIATLLDHYTDRLKKGAADAIDIPAMRAAWDSSGGRTPAYVEGDLLAKVGPSFPEHSGRSWGFWRDLAHRALEAQESGRFGDLDPQQQRVMTELLEAFKPLLVPRDPVTLELLEEPEKPK
jgi:hypothetical protein